MPRISMVSAIFLEFLENIVKPLDRELFEKLSALQTNRETIDKQTNSGRKLPNGFTMFDRKND